jgi:GTP-binding protein
VVSSSLNPNAEIYEGQVIGENSRSDDMCVNVTKRNSLTFVLGNDEKQGLFLHFLIRGSFEYIQKMNMEGNSKIYSFEKIYLTETDRKRFKI